MHFYWIMHTKQAAYSSLIQSTRPISVVNAAKQADLSTRSAAAQVGLAKTIRARNA
uniref:Uncharacterized protein n=1 Tax=Arundo donax TaxID=35708 RepID=A0A0A9H244_ARUDO